MNMSLTACFSFARFGRYPAYKYQHVIAIVILALALAMQSGCALLPDTAFPGIDGKTGGLSKNDRLALDNIHDVMSQLLEPRVTTIQVGPANSPYEMHMIELMADAGYGIQRVDADQGAAFLTVWRTPPKQVKADGVVSFRVHVGLLGLIRDYNFTSNKRIKPATAMRIAGSRDAATLDDSLFKLSDEETNKMTRIKYAQTDPFIDSMPVISLITNDVVRDVTQQATNGATLSALNSGKVEVKNLAFGSPGAFTDLRAKQTRIQREVIIFPNDSMRLGEAGKGQIEKFLKKFRQNTDMIGLVGCSNGPTNLDIGNEGLALGRSKRVTEELMSLGVARERIIDEGCWSPASAGVDFPGRGVVLELLRLPLGL